MHIAMPAHGGKIVDTPHRSTAAPPHRSTYGTSCRAYLPARLYFFTPPKRRSRLA